MGSTLELAIMRRSGCYQGYYDFLLWNFIGEIDIVTIKIDIKILFNNFDLLKEKVFSPNVLSISIKLINQIT